MFGLPIAQSDTGFFASTAIGGWMLTECYLKRIAAGANERPNKTLQVSNCLDDAL